MRIYSLLPSYPFNWHESVLEREQFKSFMQLKLDLSCIRVLDSLLKRGEVELDKWLMPTGFIDSLA